MARPDGRSNGSLICGGGKHKRALGCFDDAGSVYPISYCNYQAYYEESCQIPCSVDCSMSGWTRWGRCGDILQGQTTPDVSRYLPCGENNKVRYKIRMEKPEHGGRPCPNVDSHGQVYEVRPCHTECEEKFWWATNWNTCQIKRRIGVQTQTVMCFQTWRTSGLLDTAKPEGDERLCDLETRPFGSRKCTPPPPGTCVFSEWSPWRPCTLKSGILSGAPGTCEEATRTRSRMILRSPAQSDACEGYNLTEKENCEENFNCHTYSAEWTQWSSCMLPRGAKCGVGYIKRRSNCIRSDGLPVYAGKCKSLNITLPRWQSSQCRVACQVDCRVSDWSVWSSCSSSCGLNRIRTRQRQILRLSSSSGRPCPTDLHQVRPCCAKPCYEWKLLGWGQCQVGEGNCGVGVQQRIVVCRQQDGIEIDRQQCILHQSISDGGNGRVEDKFSEEQLLQICHVPCPGECIMTSWSSWSDCHGNCDSSLPPEAYGRKTRSRVNYVVGGIEGANCNKYEIEESICSDPVCITYNWETGPFINGTRQVWCSRSDDGSKVSSGCPHHSKPSLTSDPPACSQDCDSIPHSSCTSVGACECISPYRPYNEGRTLIRCIEPTKENPKTAQYDLEWARNEVDVEATPSYSNSSSFTVADVEIEDWNLLSPVEEDGSLKIWAYIAIAVLFIVVIFIIAVVYLSYVACRRRERYKPDSDRRRRGRTNSSNNNVGVGMVVNSSGGSSVYDTRGNGYPPYFVSPVKPSPNPRYVSVRAFSRTSSTRSGYTFPDRYDSDID